MRTLDKIDIGELNLDQFGESNKRIFDFEEMEFSKESLYRALSLLCISLIDLGLLELEE